MSFYPFNTNVARRAQTDVSTIRTQLGAGVMYTPGSPLLDDADYYVASTNMKNGAYTLANTAPDCGARNVTVTQTAKDTEDTNGTITVVGTDLAGNVISEVITPDAGKTVAGTQAFASITSITGAGWAIDATDATNDTITVGFGALIGLPDMLTDTAQVLAASLNNVREAVDPGVTVSPTVLSLNTVDLASPLNGSPVKIYYVV